MKRKCDFLRINCPEGITEEEAAALKNLTAEIVLTPRKDEASELITLPRKEYERLLRTEALFAAVSQIIRHSDLSSYTLSQVLEAVFQKPAPAEDNSKDTDAEVTPDA